MKKLIKSILAIAMCFSLCGCQSEESNSSVLDKVETNSQNTNDNVVLKRTYAVPGKSIYIDVTKWADKKLSYTWYSSKDDKFIAIVPQKRSDAIDLETAHADAIEWFHEDAIDEVTSNQLNVIKDSYVTINGVDMYQYEGTLRCSTDNFDLKNPEKQREIYAKGYSFIMDGVPCTVIGGVLGDEQAQSDIDEVSEIIDAMIKTLRSEE